MPLIKCPECGKEISSQASACPSCGFPIEGLDIIEEFSFDVGNSMQLISSQEKIKIEYMGRKLLEAPFAEFVLNWDKESEEYGKTQHMTVFSHPSCDKPFKISSNKGTQLYDTQIRFLDSIVEKHFRKDIQNDYYVAGIYASKHCEAGSVSQTRQTIETVRRENEPEKREEKFYEAEYFTIVMLLFLWPVGLFLMYKYKHFKPGTRVFLTILCALLACYIIF